MVAHSLISKISQVFVDGRNFVVYGRHLGALGLDLLVQLQMQLLALRIEHLLHSHCTAPFVTLQVFDHIWLRK